MFLVKQEQQPTSSSASSSTNSFIIDAASSSSPYGHGMDYANNRNSFWPLQAPPPPPYSAI